jgi:glycosyltransferase involved in cell wall biosynthesis
VLRNRGELRSPALILRLFQQPVAALCVARLVRREKIDIVHSNSSAVIAGALGAFLARRPHVWHVREMLPESAPVSSIMRWLVCHLSHRVICISRAVAARLLNDFSKQAPKVVIIPDGIDVDAFLALTARANGKPKQEYRIGINSRITPRKGHDTFVEAASLVHRHVPNSRFFVAGGCLDVYEPFRRQVAARADDLGLNGNLVWAGQLPYVALARLLATYDVLVLPSSEPEGLGFVLLEAMACGKPVVATAHGGPLDVVIDGVTGLLVPPDDPPAMAAAIERLLSSAEMRREMGTAGKSRLQEHFTLDKEVDRLMTVYGEIGGRGAR